MLTASTYALKCTTNVGVIELPHAETVICVHVQCSHMGSPAGWGVGGTNGLSDLAWELSPCKEGTGVSSLRPSWVILPGGASQS